MCRILGVLDMKLTNSHIDTVALEKCKSSCETTQIYYYMMQWTCPLLTSVHLNCIYSKSLCSLVQTTLFKNNEEDTKGVETKFQQVTSSVYSGIKRFLVPGQEHIRAKTQHHAVTDGFYSGRPCQPHADWCYAISRTASPQRN